MSEEKETKVFGVESAYGPFSVKVSVELTPEQQAKLVEKGLVSELYRGGNSVADKAFAPKKLNKKLVMSPDLTNFKRESVQNTPENVSTLKGVLDLFFSDPKAPIGSNVVITISEKEATEKADGIKSWVKKAEAWLVGKKPEMVKKAVGILLGKNKGAVAPTFDENGGVDVEAFARLLKVEAARAAAASFAEMDGLAEEESEETPENANEAGEESE